MFDQIKRFYAAALKPVKTSKTSQKSSGAGQLQPQEPPQSSVKPKQQSFPGYSTTITPSKNAILKTDLSSANQSLASQYRTGTTAQILRNLARVTPDLSAAVSAQLRLGIPENYIAIAENPDGSFNVDATRLVMEMLNRWSRSPNYGTGFSQIDSLRSVAEGCGKEGVIEGGMMLELVLDDQRMPLELSPISVTQLKFYEDDKGLKPVQVVGGVDVDLDYPTVFFVVLDPSIIDPYPQSPIESAIQPTLASAQFLDDLRRVCNRHVYPRYDLEVNEEKLRANIPPEIAADEEKKTAYIQELFDSAVAMIEDAGVEDALVHFDFIKVAYVQGQADVPETFTTVRDIHNAKLATGAKTMPAILGHGAGSQNIASTETMLAMLTANSIVRIKLQELFSRALTMACKLYGYDVTVGFEYDTIDLRPAAELEAFKTMKQERLLNLLSLGLITDEECCLRLTGKLPPPGYVLRTGTDFKVSASGAGQQNPYSGTGAGGGQSGGGAAVQSGKSQTPEKSKGK